MTEERLQWFGLTSAADEPGFHLVLAKATGELRRFWLNAVTLYGLGRNAAALLEQVGEGEGVCDPPRRSTPPMLATEERRAVSQARTSFDEGALWLRLENEDGADLSALNPAQARGLVASITAALQA